MVGAAAMAALLLELAYGVVCWRVFRGSRMLLAAIVLFNLANVTFFSAALPGPKELLARHPAALAPLVLAQIVVTLVVVGVLARRWSGAAASATPSRRAPPDAPGPHARACRGPRPPGRRGRSGSRNRSPSAPYPLQHPAGFPADPEETKG